MSLVAEVWRRPREPKTASYELFGSAPVEILHNHGHTHLHAAVPMGFETRRSAYLWCWVVRRSNGSTFEKRRISSFRLLPDPHNERASDKADDWPCEATYGLHLATTEALMYLTDPAWIRDPVTLEFIHGSPPSMDRPVSP